MQSAVCRVCTIGFCVRFANYILQNQLQAMTLHKTDKATNTKLVKHQTPRHKKKSVEQNAQHSYQYCISEFYFLKKSLTASLGTIRSSKM